MFLYGFMQRAFQASILISIIAPILGLFLILRRQSLMADTLSHVSLVGIALGLLIGAEPTITNIFVVILAALLLEYLRSLYRSYSEISIAILMSGGMALALVLMTFSSNASAMSIDSFLFGSIVTISSLQITLLAVLSVMIVILYAVFRNPMYILTFDEETAFTAGLPVRWMSILFNVLTGVTVAIIMPIMGALLVSAVLILPAAISMRISKSFNGVIILGIVFSLIGTIAGLVLSYQYATPPGATITLIFLGIFVVVSLFKK